NEHVKARSINQIDLYTAPFGKGNGIGHGSAARHIFFVIRGDGRAVLHPPPRRRHLGGIKQCGDQGSFAAVGMPYDSDIADIIARIDLHSKSPPASGESSHSSTATSPPSSIRPGNGRPCPNSDPPKCVLARNRDAITEGNDPLFTFWLQI